VARFLLDTHLLLWAAGEPHKLGHRATEILENVSHEVVFSAASIWEVAIKSALNRADFVADAEILARELRRHGFVELPVRAVHAARVGALPALHADPFDRILVAQARLERLTLLTHDRRVAAYPGDVELV
jgi:PIN domain nuclease of toxin-antitoxin system